MKINQQQQLRSETITAFDREENMEPEGSAGVTAFVWIVLGGLMVWYLLLVFGIV